MDEKSKKQHDDLLTPAEAAERLGVHGDTVRRWCDSGRLDCIVHPLTRHRLVRSSEVERMLADVDRMT